jgi:hypothetical protein
MVLNRDQWDFGAILLISSGAQADNFQVADDLETIPIVRRERGT